MNFRQLNAVIDATKLSPEQLAPIFDVGSMTIRRWQKELGSKKVPKNHRWSIIQSVYQLVLEGKLGTEDKAVQVLLEGSTPLSFQAVIKGMGVAETSLLSSESQQDKMMTLLSQIGGTEQHRREVERSFVKLHYFRKLGADWQKRIGSLLQVVRSKKLSLLDKWVAYGALFYLITPLDLIPDHLPVIGLIDDFGVLGFALSYYLRRYPDLFSSRGILPEQV